MNYAKHMKSYIDHMCIRPRNPICACNPLERAQTYMNYVNTCTKPSSTLIQAMTVFCGFVKVAAQCQGVSLQSILGSLYEACRRLLGTFISNRKCVGKILIGHANRHLLLIEASPVKGYVRSFLFKLFREKSYRTYQIQQG